ncbi:MAG: MlaE family lipid ABC transporter permease subunit [Gammaproteobacteria bacterium]
MTEAHTPQSLPADIQATPTGLRLSGAWTLHGIAGLEKRLARLAPSPAGAVVIDAEALSALDTAGALMLVRLIQRFMHAGREARLTGLSPPRQALVNLVTERLLASATPPLPSARPNFLARLGEHTLRRLAGSFDLLAFTGEVAITLARLLLQPWRIRWRALFLNVETAGVDALPIVALLAFLMGVVIAYQGGQQLKYYGANIFIVELVTITMLREIAPLITAIIVAGRTGSAYTAELGTMKVTEEIDALRTIGIAPLELLVLPKMLALVIALPLLCMFADILSVFGGMVMAQFQLDVSFREFIDRVPQAVSLTSFLIGIGKAPLFAAVIALVGCYQGFQVRGGADSVGRQTTVSVVQAIFLVIVVDAVIAVALSALGL